MNRTKRRVLRFAMVLGLIVLVPACLVFTAIRRQQQNVRLAEAVYLENEARVQALLAAHADPNALMQPPRLTLGDLLERAFQPESHRGHRSTILMYAANHCNERILRSLLDAGGDVHDETSYGFTALDIAVDSFHHRNVALLVQYGSNVNGSGPPITPLQQAISHSPNLEDVSCLLAHGADPNRHAEMENSPLNYAVDQGDPATVSAPVRAGATVNVRKLNVGEFGYTALMSAGRNGNTKTVEVLLRAGANIDATVATGETALIYAAESGQREAVVTLLKAGADRTLRCKDGETAEDQAVTHGFKEVARLLYIYRPAAAK